MWALSLTTGPQGPAVRANVPSLACPSKRQKVKSKMESLLRRKVHAEWHTGEIRESFPLGKFKSCIRRQRHYFANKGLSNQTCGFSSGHVGMWELVYKESWVPKNWCFWTVVLEKTLESPSDCKEIQAVHPKENQSWIFIGRTNVEAETPKLWPPDAKNWLIWKHPDAGKD